MNLPRFAKLFSLVAFAALLIPTTDVRAEYLTGNDLYRYCTAERSRPDYHQNSALCLGYIMGVHDGAETSGNLLTLMAELDQPFRLICVPETVEAGQLRDIVVAFLRDHPEDRNLAAGLNVMSALLAAYPCGNS